jgi:hypothetical protein
MNTKTTLLLIAVLIVVGTAYFYVARQAQQPPVAKTPAGQVLQVASSDMQKISITSPDAKPVVLQRQGPDWKITSPISANAEKWAVDGLASALAGLSSRGEASLENKSAMGLDKPTVVEIAGKDGRSAKLAIGSRSAVGDVTYVVKDDAAVAQIVGADVLEKLEDPVKKFRDPRLNDLVSLDVKQFAVRRSDGDFRFEKIGEEWQMISPEKMPVESTEMSDMVSAVAGLRAGEIVSEDAKDAAKYGLVQPRMVAFATTVAPSTQPSATQPAGVQVRVGGYDDIRKQSVYAMVGDGGPIAKVSASIIQQLSKKPLDLRARKLLEIDPATVNRIALSTQTPATTQPTTREASSSAVTVVRNPAAAVSSPATTQAATLPVAPAWVLEGTQNAADETKAGDLLRALQPLRAAKYLAGMPEGKFGTVYVLGIRTVAAGGAQKTLDLKIIERGETESPIGQFNGLTFELDRDILSKLKLQ